MLKSCFKKYWLIIVLFALYQLALYYFKINDKNPLPYINFLFYFSTFLLIRENLPLTQLDKNIVYLFFFFYGYLSVFLSLLLLARTTHYVDFIGFVYGDVGIKFFILNISIYIALNSFKLNENNHHLKLVFSIVLTAMVVGINYFQYLKNPFVLAEAGMWSDYSVRNYVSIVLSIIALLVFWYRYYQKYLVVTEYLNSVIFLFTLSNIIEALHFVAYQNKFQVFIYGQIFNFCLNVLVVVIWYLRLVYLHSDISAENERYLMNFQVLNGIVAKPKQSFLSRIISFVSIHYLTAGILTIMLLIVGLYLINKITFYILLNTVFILFAVFLALFFSFSSIKRDWHNQVGFLFKKGDKFK